MLKVPNIRTEILLGIDNWIKNSSRVNASSEEMAKHLLAINKEMSNLQKMSSITETRIKGLSTTLANMASAYQTLSGIQNMFSNILGGAYNYSKTLETNAVGISGILTSMVKVNGKQLEWNESMAMSTEIMSKLRKEALRTSSTAPELIETFRGILGPALGAGMKIDEVMRLTTVGVNAVKSIGLDGPQLLQELRSMIQGNIRPASSTLATALGIDNVQIKNAKNSTEGLYKFLMDKLVGFERSVKATSKTIKGRLDILKEGIYQGIEVGTKPLWEDIKREIEGLSKNFLIVNEETQKTELNPKFVKQVEDITDKFLTVKESIAPITNFLSSNASSFARMLVIGTGLKLMQSAISGIIGLTNNGVNKLKQFGDWISPANARLKEQLKLEQQLASFNEKWDYKVARQQELVGLTDKLTYGVNSLKKTYQELGASEEKAAKYQNIVVKAINNGKSVDEINKLNDRIIDLIANTKLYGQVKSSIAELDKKSIADAKEREAIEKRIAELREKSTKGLMNAISVGSKNVNSIKDEAGLYSGGKRTDSSLRAFEQNVLKSDDRLWKETFTKQQAILQVKELIWRGDFEAAEKSIEDYNKQISEIGTELKLSDEKLQKEKEIAKARQEQYNWLEKQINASIKLDQAQSKNNDALRNFKLFQNSVKENIASKISDRKEAKLTKDEAYIQNFINGKTKSKAYTPENVEMVNSIMKALKGVGIEQKYITEYTKRFINQLQSAKVSADTIKQKYESIIETGKRLSEINKNIENNASNVFQKALSVNLGKQEAEKLKQEYICVAKESGEAGGAQWQKAFDKHIETVKERLSGVLRGTQAGTNKFSMPTFTSAENLAHAKQELEFDYKCTIDAYTKINKVGAEKIESALKIIKDAQKEELLTAEQASKLELEYKLKVVGGYYEEALAIQEVIEAQAKEGRLAGENARKEREQASVKAKKQAINKQNIIDLQIIEKLNGDVLTSVQRNASKFAEQQALQGKGYTKTEEALKKLWEAEEKMANKIKETGMVAPPVYNELIKLAVKLREAEHELTEEEKKHLDVLLKKVEAMNNYSGKTQALIKGFSSLGGVLTSTGFIIQGIGVESDTTAGKFAEWAIQIGFVGSSVLTLVDNLKELWTAIRDIKIIGTGLQIGMLGKVGGAIAAIGAGTVAMKLHQEGVDLTDTKQVLEILKERYSGKSQEEVDAMRAEYNAQKALELLDKNKRGSNNAKVNNGNVTLNNPPDDGGSDKKKNAIEKLKEQARSAKDAYQVLVDNITNANNKLNSGVDKYTEKAGEAQKKIDAWKKSLNDLLAKGGEYSELNKDDKEYVEALLDDYNKLVKAEIERQKITDDFANSLQRIQNLQNTNSISNYQANSLRADVYKEEIQYMQDRLNNEQLSADERFKIETDLAAKKKALREAEQQQLKIDYDDILAHIKNFSYNQTETIKSAYDSIRDNFANFGQNMMTEGVNLGKRFTDLFKNIANTVINTLMKIAMQGLIVNSILSAFGMGKGNIFGGGVNPSATVGKGAGVSTLIGGSSANIGLGGSLIGGFAKGGIADGWSIVGEKGPELVNFSNPARVYTADQTRNALSGGNSGNLNIKFDIKNNTNQQIEARQTGQTFDGESYVIGVVLNAVATNQNGMRSALKGALST